MLKCRGTRHATVSPPFRLKREGVEASPSLPIPLLR